MHVLNSNKQLTYHYKSITKTCSRSLEILYTSSVASNYYDHEQLHKIVPTAPDLIATLGHLLKRQTKNYLPTTTPEVLAKR